MNCDTCISYDWYYDMCRKWDCEVDHRSVCNHYKKIEAPIRDAMVGATGSIIGDILNTADRGDTKE